MYRYFGVISLHRCQFWLEWILLLLGSWTQTFCILVAHENSTFQHLKFTVSVPCVFGKQVLYWILKFHRTMNWCMFVMLLKVASSLCGLFFYFCACEEIKVIKAGFFSQFSRRWISKFLAHRQIEIQTLSGKTAQMCMLAWSFSARICVKYLNNLAWAFIYIPSF